MFINQPDALDLLTSVEGEDWRQRQLAGDFGNFSFEVFLKCWQEVDQGLLAHRKNQPYLTDMGLSVEGDGAIYGCHGWSRYTVRYSGEIMFIEMQSPSEEVSDRARKAGFRFFPADLPKPGA